MPPAPGEKQCRYHGLVGFFASDYIKELAIAHLSSGKPKGQMLLLSLLTDKETQIRGI